ncbi:TPA: calcium/proton exchanger [Legionella anisa]
MSLSKPNLYWLIPFILITVACDYFYPEKAIIIFFSACIAIVPLAALLSEATNHIASRAGDVIGGFLNATFGNATEFIIALVALYSGKVALVKATITGSIIGNILLVLGFSFFIGGIKNKTQHFNQLGAESLSTGLSISVVSLIIPAAYLRFSAGTENIQYNQLLSYSISIALLIIYVSFLYFSLFTHRNLIADENTDGDQQLKTEKWSLSLAVFMLFIAAVLIAFMSEILVHHVEHATKALGISTAFVGIIIVAMVGNAAEHSTAVVMALKNKMDVSINIAIGSSTQIALFIVPLLVLLSGFFPVYPMDLIFSNGEMLLIVLSTFILTQIISTGVSTWYKGVQLLGVYSIIAIALYFVY